MDSQVGILQQVHPGAAVKRVLLPPAVQHMARPERMISPAEVRQIVYTGEII
jgi:hypothetical protein